MQENEIVMTVKSNNGERVKEIRNKMSENERRMLYLRERGMTLGQISRLTNTGIPSVRRILSQAMRKVRDYEMRYIILEQAMRKMAIGKSIGSDEVDIYILDSMAVMKKLSIIPEKWEWF